MFWKKVCSKCSTQVDFDFTIIDTVQGARFDNPINKRYCKTHFIEMIKESLLAFNKPFIFYVPVKFYEYNQLIYYTAKTLPNDNYAKEDCDDVLRLLEIGKSAKDEANIIAIDRETVGDVYTAPLIKVDDPKYRLIDHRTFLSMLSDVILKFETKEAGSKRRGAFSFCLPYGDNGIYLWFEM